MVVEASLEAAPGAEREVAVASEAHQEVVVVSWPVDVVAEAVSAQEVVDSAAAAAHLGAVEEVEDVALAGKQVGCTMKKKGIGTAFRGAHVRARLGLRLGRDQDNGYVLGR